jgi:hypothetical protein
MMQRVVVLNFTKFFRRELYMYAFGDIKLRKPISLKKVGYTVMFGIIWTLPLFLIIGIKFNLFYVAILLGVPVVLGNLASRPIFGGKGMFDYLRAIFGFIGESKIWTDLEGTRNRGEDILFADNEYWVSRRREIAILEKLTSSDSSY